MFSRRHPSLLYLIMLRFQGLALCVQTRATVSSGPNLTFCDAVDAPHFAMGMPSSLFFKPERIAKSMI